MAEEAVDETTFAVTAAEAAATASLVAKLGGRALLVVDSQGANASDRRLAFELVRAGFEVQTKPAVATTMQDTVGMRLVVISESTLSSDLGSRLRDAPVPIISMEPSLSDDLGMSGPTWATDYGDQSAQTQLLIRAPGHLATAQLQGTVTVTTGPSKFVWARPSSSAVVVAALVGDGAPPGIFAYERGAAMVGLVAPARRAFCFAGRDTPFTLSESGWALWRSLVIWAAQPAALMVVGGVPLSGADQAMRSRLESLGMVVDAKKAVDLRVSDAAARDFGLVSESSFSDDVGDKLTAATIPLMLMEPAHFDDALVTGPGWLVGFGDTQSASAISIVAPGHPVAAGLSGNVAVVSSPSKFVWGASLAPSAQVIANVDGEPSHAAIFAYEKGMAGVDGKPLPHRRLGWFAGRDAPAVFSADGWRLFDSGVRWLLGLHGRLASDTCGLRIADFPANSVDACTKGATVGAGVLPVGTGATTIQIPFAALKNAEACVQVVASSARVSTPPALLLDNITLGIAAESRAPVEVRKNVNAGAHSLAAIHAGPRASNVTVTVRTIDAALSSGPRVSSGPLSVTALIANPSTILPGANGLLTAVFRIRPAASLAAETVDYRFEIFATTGCQKVRTLSGRATVAGLSQFIHRTWDGRNEAGQAASPGSYLFTFALSLQRGSAPPFTLVTPAARVRIYDSRTAAECRKAVLDPLIPTLTPTTGLAPLDTLAVTSQILACGNPDPSACEVDFAGAIMVDRRRTSSAYLEGQLRFEEYLHIARDRTRKFQLSDDDPSWIPAACRGDGDSDLVPDDRDQCPDTPRFTATDDHGCTDSNLPPAPPPGNRIRELVLSSAAFFGQKCEAAGRPTISAIRTMCQGGDGSLRIFLTPVVNQPNDCQLFYVVEGDFLGIDKATGTERRARFSAALGPKVPQVRHFDNQGKLIAIEFPVPPSLVGGLWQEIAPASDWSSVSWSVTTVNAAHTVGGTATGSLMNVSHAVGAECQN